jgi:vancomycin aglycone glucosyltransferase
MRVLLFTIGSRGEVQPLLALAQELRALGHEPKLCAPPNFAALASSCELEFVPIGPDVRNLSRAPRPAIKPSLAQRKLMGGAMVRGQFAVLPEAARGCDMIVGGGALAIAARSIAEAVDARYRFVAFCPVTFPMPGLAPLNTSEWVNPGVYRTPSRRRHQLKLLWSQDARSFNNVFGEALNEGRAELGLTPVRDVRRHVFGVNPWLSADPTLAPAGPGRLEQTGAWFLRLTQRLPAVLEAFLSAGDPPVYFGFGSMVGAEGRPLVEAARALGLRSIVSRGWAELDAGDEADDWLAIDEADHELLFPRVAAVVHHGGAGTTSAAARAGTPQLIVPRMFDQFYFAQRVQQLGIGTLGPIPVALRACIQPDVKARAAALALRIVGDGAQRAARAI